MVKSYKAADLVVVEEGEALVPEGHVDELAAVSAATRDSGGVTTSSETAADDAKTRTTLKESLAKSEEEGGGGGGEKKAPATPDRQLQLLQAQHSKHHSLKDLTAHEKEQAKLR